jgi:hypothetical protein
MDIPMREVHPEFDPATSTWFVGAKEARTIRELLVKLGGPDKVCAIGYKPIGAAAPLIVRDPHDRSVLGKALNAAIRSSLDDADDRVELARPSQAISPKHVAKRQAERSIPAPVQAFDPLRSIPAPVQAFDPLAISPLKPKTERKRYSTPEEKRAGLLASKKRYNEKRAEHRALLRAAEIEKHLPPVPAEWLAPAPALPKNWAPRPSAGASLRPVHKPRPTIDKTFGVGIGFPARAATAQERDQWTEIENAVLDMWAEGKNGPDIAKALNVKVQFVGSNVVWKARIEGDPRAVVRCPNAIGKRHNRPKHNAHTSGRNRNYARIVERARNADGGKDKADRH